MLYNSAKLHPFRHSLVTQNYEAVENKIKELKKLQWRRRRAAGAEAPPSSRGDAASEASDAKKLHLPITSQ